MPNVRSRESGSGALPAPKLTSKVSSHLACGGSETEKRAPAGVELGLMGEANCRPVALVVLELEGRAHTRRADTVDRERRRGLRIAEREVVGLDGDDVREVGGQLEIDGE